MPKHKKRGRLNPESAYTRAHSPKKIKNEQQIRVVSFIPAVCAICCRIYASADIFENEFIERHLFQKVGAAEHDVSELRIVKDMRF